MTELVWDDRLISRERALRLAGDWPVYASIGYAQLEQYEIEGGDKLPGQWQVNQRCGRCHASIALLATFAVRPGLNVVELAAHLAELGDQELTARDYGWLGTTLIQEVTYEATSVTRELAAVLRHMVTAHDTSLSGAER